MSNSTIDVTGSFDNLQKLLRIVDNGDGTYSVAVTAPVGLTKTDDNIVITYTDATKATISTVVFKEGVTTKYTLTLTQATLTDTWTRT